jgi:hypothetical protein
MATKEGECAQRLQAAHANSGIKSIISKLLNTL